MMIRGAGYLFQTFKPQNPASCRYTTHPPIPLPKLLRWGDFLCVPLLRRIQINYDDWSITGEIFGTVISYDRKTGQLIANRGITRESFYQNETIVTSL